MADDRRILEQYPLPLARAYRRYLNASEVRERHDAAYYLFEVYLKYTAAVAIAHYLAGESRDHRVNAALKGLARPSLGEWLRFLRECLRFFKEERGAEEETDPSLAALGDLLESKDALRSEAVRLYNRLRAFRTGSESRRDKASPGMLLEELVPYRNRVLGHGAPLEREHYEEYGALLGRAFPELLARSPFLVARRLVAFDSVQVEEGSWIECGTLEYMGVNPMRRQSPHRIEDVSEAPRKDVLYLLGERGSLLLVDPLLVAHREDVYILNEAGGAPEYLSYSTGERYTPSRVGEAQQDLFQRILGYRVDAARLTRIGDDLAEEAEAPAEVKLAEGERRLGDYRLIREVGRGAMGAVFEAVQESLGRRVALKVLSGSVVLDPRRVERFRREARATAKIHHPNIVPVYDVGEAEGSHFYAMEYIDGPSLDEVISEAREEAIELIDDRPDAYYHRARVHLFLGHHEDCLSDLKAALDCRGDFLPARMLEAEALARRGELEAARKLRDEIEKEEWDEWSQMWLRAYDSLRGDDWDAKTEALGELIRFTENADPEPYVGAAIHLRLERGLLCLDAPRFGKRSLVTAYGDFAVVQREMHHHLGPALLRGRADLAFGEKEEADKYFRKLLDRHNSKKEEVILGVTGVYLEGQDYDGAKRWVDKLDPSAVRDRISSMLFFFEGKNTQALQAAKDAAQREPEHALSHLLLGFVYLNSIFDFVSAETCLKKAIRLDEQNPYAHFWLGFAYCKRGKYREAVEPLRKARDLERGNPGFLGLSSFVRAATGKLSEALAMNDDAAKLAPRDATIHYYRGWIFERIEGEFDKALEAYDKSIDTDPQLSYPRWFKAELFWRLGRFEKTKEVLENMGPAYPRLEFVHAELAWCYWIEGNVEKAIRYLEEKEGEEFPGGFLMHYYLGNFYWWSGEPAEAQKHFQKAIKTNDNHFWLHYHYAEFLASEGRDSKALEQYAEALRLRSTDRFVHTPIWFLLPRVEKDPKAGGAVDEILAQLESSASEKKPSPLCLKTAALAWIYHPTQRSPEMAIDRAEKLVGKEKTEEEDPEALGIAAEVYERAGDLQEAVRLLKEAAPLPEADPRLEIRLWRLRETLGPQPRKMEFWIPEKSEWHFFKGREEPEAEWKNPDFNPPGWDQGTAPFGFGLRPPRCHTKLTDMAGRYRTLYVRKKFTVDNRAEIQQLWLLVWAVDGFVAYLNGKEVGRKRAGDPGTPVPHDQFAEAKNSSKDLVRLELNPAELEEGENCVAIQGLIVNNHQYGFFLDARLVAWVGQE